MEGMEVDMTNFRKKINLQVNLHVSCFRNSRRESKAQFRRPFFNFSMVDST